MNPPTQASLPLLSPPPPRSPRSRFPPARAAQPSGRSSHLRRCGYSLSVLCPQIWPGKISTAWTSRSPRRDDGRTTFFFFFFFFFGSQAAPSRPSLTTRIFIFVALKSVFKSIKNKNRLCWLCDRQGRKSDGATTFRPWIDHPPLVRSSCQYYCDSPLKTNPGPILYNGR